MCVCICMYVCARHVNERACFVPLPPHPQDFFLPNGNKKRLMSSLWLTYVAGCEITTLQNVYGHRNTIGNHSNHYSLIVHVQKTYTILHF